MSDLDYQTIENVIKVVRQLGHVTVERAELATVLGFETDAAIERALGRRFHQLAGQARYLFEACDKADARSAEAEADPDNIWAAKAKPMSVMDMLNRLTPGQRDGVHCFICAGGISAAAPDMRSAAVGGVQLFIHIEPAVCTAELARRFAEEVPF